MDFERMAQTYEATLRRILTEADEEARLYEHRTGKGSTVRVGDYELGVHDAFKNVRTLAADALREFHPEV
jgi:hypothetical protein